MKALLFHFYINCECSGVFEGTKMNPSKLNTILFELIRKPSWRNENASSSSVTLAKSETGPSDVTEFLLESD